jgi:hypothetical protein
MQMQCRDRLLDSAVARLTLAHSGIVRGGAGARPDLHVRSCALRRELVCRLRLNVARGGNETVVAILAHGTGESWNECRDSRVGLVRQWNSDTVRPQPKAWKGSPGTQPETELRPR